MHRDLCALCFALVCTSACASTPAPAQPRQLMDQLVTDPSGRAQVAVLYRPQDTDMVEISLDIIGVGVDEMDKFAIDVKLDGFVLVEGSTQWSGYAPPRQRQKHRMLLRVMDDTEFATMTVIMTRFHDSALLWQDEATFRATDEGVVVAGA